MALSCDKATQIWDNIWSDNGFQRLGFEPPSGRDIFCLKNFDTFTRTSVRVSKINAVTRTQLSFQMLTLLPKISILPEPVFKTWNCKGLALITQMVRAFGMNPVVGGSSPPQVDTFSVFKTLTLSE